jgi:hypothetical protein
MDLGHLMNENGSPIIITMAFIIAPGKDRGLGR